MFQNYGKKKVVKKVVLCGDLGPVYTQQHANKAVIQQKAYAFKLHSDNKKMLHPYFSLFYVDVSNR